MSRDGPASGQAPHTATKALQLCIYNPSLGQTDDTVEKQILYYFAEAHVTQHDKLRTIGLLQGIVEFSKTFNSETLVDLIVSNNAKTVLYLPEPDFTIAMIYPNQSTAAADDSIFKSIVRDMYREFRLRHGPMQHILDKEGVDSLKDKLSSRFDKFLRELSITSDLLNCCILNGIKTASITLNSFERMDKYAQSLRRHYAEILDVIITNTPQRHEHQPLLLYNRGFLQREDLVGLQLVICSVVREQNIYATSTSEGPEESANPWYTWRGSTEWTKSIIPALRSPSDKSEQSSRRSISKFIIGLDTAQQNDQKIYLSDPSDRSQIIERRMAVYTANNLCCTFVFEDSPITSDPVFYDYLAQSFDFISASIPVGEQTTLDLSKADFFHLVFDTDSGRIYNTLPLILSDEGTPSNYIDDVIHAIEQVNKMISSKSGEAQTCKSMVGQWVIKFKDGPREVYLVKRRHIDPKYKSRSHSKYITSGDSVEDVERDGRRFYNRLRHHDHRIWHAW